LAEVVDKLSKVPFDRIGTHLDQSLVELKTSLNDADALFRQLDSQVAPEAKATLQETRKSFSAAQQALSADAPLQQDARNALQELQRAAESLRALSEYLSRHPESLIRGKAQDEP
jgi:paraquat-inducible protein B